jgi:methanogenic corrinoid protein MtbC1
MVGMLALLSSIMRKMRWAVEPLKEMGFRDKVKGVVGGASLTATFGPEIGPDGRARCKSRSCAG